MRTALGKILAFTSIVEFGTGLILLLDPAVVVKLLLGTDTSAVVAIVGRCFGVALLGLSVACWPGGQRFDSRATTYRAMLIYNALIAAYLVYLYIVEHVGGILLWPAAVLHAIVAALLVWAWRSGRATQVADK